MKIVISTDERQPNARYRGALLCAGALPEQVELAFPGRPLPKGFDALLLAGGADVEPSRYGAAAAHPAVESDPARDALDFALLEEATASGAPVFGICRGLQVMNVALGGTLWQDLPSERGGELRHEFEREEGFDPSHPAHEVSWDGRASDAAVAFAPLAPFASGRTMVVNSRHHQGVRDLAPSLVPAALSPDGLVEAFERPGAFFAAVQWHPEDLVARPPHAALFRAFLAAAESHARGRGKAPSPPVEVLLEGQIPVVRLGRGHAGSTLTTSTAALLSETIAALASDPTVPAVVLTGGTGGFCSGLDPDLLDALLGAGDEDGWRELLLASARAARSLLAAPRPIVAAIDGLAAGAGLTLALACDFRVASSAGDRSAMFRLGNAVAGMAPPPGAAALLSTVAGPGAAADLAFSAEPLPAARARTLRLVDHLVEDGPSLPWAVDRASFWAEHPVEALSATKSALDCGRLGRLDAALDGEIEAHMRLFRAGLPARRLAALKRARSNRQEKS